MTADEQVEAVARTMAEHRNGGSWDDPAFYHETHKVSWRSTARAVIAMLAPKWRDMGDAPTWTGEVVCALLCTVGGGVGEAELYEDGWWWPGSHGEYWGDSIDATHLKAWMPLPTAPDAEGGA
jgi:hypothetical protein